MLRMPFLFLLASCTCPHDSYHPFETGVWKKECDSGLEFTRGGFTSILNPESKRCEIANTQLLTLDTSFKLSFVFQPKYFDSNDLEWHGVFQIHSFPDLLDGEAWRCPVLSLEVMGGELRMFNRWDVQRISRLENGTCTGSGNTVKARTIFKGFPLVIGQEYLVTIEGRFSYTNSGYLNVLINNQLVGKAEGATAFNDEQGVYIKLGVYKPTSWVLDNNLEYSYFNFEFRNINAV